MNNTVSNFVKNNKQKTFCYSLIVVLIIEFFGETMYYDDNPFYFYVSNFIFFIILYSYIIIYLDSEIDKENWLLKFLYFSPILILYYYNRAPIIFSSYSYRDPDTLLDIWSWAQENAMGLWIFLMLRLFIASVAFALFNIFWIKRYKSHLPTTINSSSGNKWKRYNIIARVLFAFFINLAFLGYFYPIYTYDFIDGFNGMTLVAGAFIVGGFYYIILDWFSEVIRLLSNR